MSKAGKRRRKIASRKLTMQALQSRQLMAADIAFNADYGTLNITGDDSANLAVGIQDDSVQISLDYQDDQGQTQTMRREVDVDDIRSIWFQGVGGDDTMRIYRDTNNENVGSKINLLFFGGSGNDEFNNQTNLVSRAYGGADDDVLGGGSSQDFLDAAVTIAFMEQRGTT